MNQKMEPLLGTVGTCIVGGIVWGLWHLPMDIAGCNGAISDAMSMCGGRMIQLTLFGVFLINRRFYFAVNSLSEMNCSELLAIRISCP